MVFQKKAWVVSVEMGYGHMRAARPLRVIAGDGKIISADNYEGIPKRDRSIWGKSAKVYYFFSRLSDKGMLGNLLFKAFNHFQEIGDVEKKEARPNLQLKSGYALIRRGWGKHLIEKLNKNPVPLIATFFTVGHMAEYWGYKGEIYVITTDSDISRAWAPLEPAGSRINYLASTKTAKKHLQSYGVDPKKIHLSGFPLPQELVTEAPLFKPRKPLAVTFAVGGAGVQAKIGKEIVKGLRPLIREKKVILCIVLGTHRNLASQFREESGINVFSCKTKKEYFESFNKIIAKTDVLWTKPSELSFYAGLGLPIIIAPPLGAQEEKNREWLLKIGAGIDQKNPLKAYNWLPELLDSGALARASRAGFQKINKDAVKNISKIVLK